MTLNSHLGNRLQELRRQSGWTQAELAAKSGASRSAIAAIELNTLSPSVHTAIAISKALNCSVEDIFGNTAHTPTVVQAWKSRIPKLGSWRAQVGPNMVEYPASTRPFLASLADDDSDPLSQKRLASKTLSIATCDPAAPLIGAAFSRETGIRVLIFNRSSRESLEMLRDGLVHVSGIHLANQENPEGNRQVASATLDQPFQLVPAVKWESGIVLGHGQRIRTVKSAISSRLSWIGREPGSGAHQTLEQLFGSRKLPRVTASSHVGVAEALRSGIAEAGICPRLVAEEQDLHFLPVQREYYDLCFVEQNADDDRIQAFLKFSKGGTFRDAIGKLPGYSLAN